MPTVEINLTPKEFECFTGLESDQISEALGGGGKGGGKTLLGCKWAYYKVKQLIKFFKLKASAHPPILGFIGRKRATDLNVTTLETWKKEIPADAYKINEQKKIINIENTASILYGGFDDRDTVNKFNSMEIAFAFLDQAEELTRNEVGAIRGAMRLKLNKLQPKYKILFTCNPPITDEADFLWIKDEFIDNPKEGRKFYKFLWKDNPFIASNYWQTLKDAYGFNPDLYAAYAEGAWDRIGAANLVLSRKVVESLIDFPLWNNHEVNHKRVTVADIAEEGGVDETVIYDFEDEKIVGQEIYAHKELMDTCGRIVAHQKKNNSNFISVDKVGSGAGVYSRLKEIYEGDNVVIVHGFDSRITEFPNQLAKETYANYRAYAYFNAAINFFRESKCSIPDDKKLIAQLCSIPFKFTSSGKMILLSKDEIKVKYGWSPDRADAYIIGLDALQYAKPVIGYEERKDYYVNPHFSLQNVA